MGTQNVEIIDLDDDDEFDVAYMPNNLPRVPIAPIGPSNAFRVGIDDNTRRLLPVHARQPTKDKGKGRARPPEIIELSDSDSEMFPAREIPANTASSSRQQNACSSRVQNGDVPRSAGSSAIKVATNTNMPNNIYRSEDTEDMDDQLFATHELQTHTSAEPAMLDKIVSAVIEVLPDVTVDHIVNLYQSQVASSTNTVLSHSVCLQSILTTLFDNPDYPKVSVSVRLKRKREAEDNAAGPSKRQRRDHIVRVLKKLDVASKDRPPIVSAAYQNLSLKNIIKTWFLSNNRLFGPTFVHLSHLRLQNFPGVDLKKQATRPLAHGPPWKDADFDREYNWCQDWTPDKNGEIQWIEESDPDEPSSRMNETEEPIEAKVESEECPPGAGADCGCCFSEYVTNTMVQCPVGHLFCKACVLAFSQERLGQRNAHLKCMDQGTCDREFERGQLGLCLPPKLMALYERIKQAEELAAAGLADLEECPFCDFKCVIENEQERLFHCLNDECGVTSCRSCKKKDHLPKTCKEAEEDNALNAQHAVEEAMTKALMRKCPKCDATFIKSDGCNKISCTKCGQLSCYVCRKAITGYEHFNQMPGGARGAVGGSKCPLWDAPNGGDGTVQLARRHHEEVTQARDAALAELRRQNPELNVNELRVDAPELGPARPAQPAQPVQQQPVRQPFVGNPDWWRQVAPINPFNAFPPFLGGYQLNLPFAPQPQQAVALPNRQEYRLPPPPYIPPVPPIAPVLPVAPIAPVAPVFPVPPLQQPQLLHQIGRACNCQLCRQLRL